MNNQFELLLSFCRYFRFATQFSLLFLCFSFSSNFPAQANANSIDGQLIGVTWGDGGPYKINPLTGDAIQIGSPRGGLFNAMARSDSNVFLASNSSNQIFSIDPLSGDATLEVSVSGVGTNETIRGMAFSNEDRLYAVLATTQHDINRFFEIDLLTGNASLVGSTGMLGIQALTVSPNGTFYGFEIAGDGLGLVTIDPTTGLATDVNPLDDHQGSAMQSLAFSHSGVLYGMGQGAIYTVDTSVGTLTQLTPFTISVRGFEFLPIPEPSSCFLLLFASTTIVSCHGRRRRRRIG